MHCNIPIFIPQLACPHACIFCNQKHISGQQKAPSMLEVKETIETDAKITQMLELADRNLKCLL